VKKGYTTARICEINLTDGKHFSAQKCHEFDKKASNGVFSITSLDPVVTCIALYVASRAVLEKYRKGQFYPRERNTQN
jgi:hypothetical protein